MESKLVGRNVVVVARQFNPSVLSQHWLIKNDIVGEQEFQPGCLFTDHVVQVTTTDFSLLLLPQQLQVVPTKDDGSEQELLRVKVGTIVARLSHTPFVAVGMNFTWTITPDGGEEGVRGLTRRLFFQPDNRIQQRFDVPNAKFGCYLSKDTLDCRLKLDMKPIVITENNSHALMAAFNYHLDLVGLDAPAEKIESMLGQWNAAKAEATDIVGLVQTDE